VVQVRSFDELDALEAGGKGTSDPMASEPPPKFQDEANVYWFSDDWLEDGPYIEDRLALSRSQVALINAVLEGRVARETPILRAARHFNEGLELHDTTTDHPEVATTLLVSALEVACADVGSVESCPCCGQLKYKLSRKVQDLARRHLGEGAAYFVKTDYERRSKYLHAGVLPGAIPDGIRIEPMLDPMSPSGCTRHRGVASPENLIEFTSYVIRAECAAWYAKAVG
jgi:hypothetical protein